jgi:hypothetical protein
MTEKKVNDSKFWYYVLPTLILILLSFFVYVLFHVSSVQLVNSNKVFQILKAINSR